MKNALKLLIVGMIAGLSFGCSTVLGIADDACDTALGGSKVGDSLCANIDTLKSEDAQE